MHKTNKEARGTLSASLARVLSELAARGQPIFDMDDFVEVLGADRVRAKKLLYQLRQSGWVSRTGRGKYSIIPLEAGPEGFWSEDAFVIACHLAQPSSVAYWSACHYWDWTEQTPRTVFVQTTMRKASTARDVPQLSYRFVQVRLHKFFGHVERTTTRGRFTITDQEKTLVDAVDHPQHCGGIRLVAAMLPEATSSLDWEKVDSYLQQLNSGAVYKRLGFLVELLGPKVELTGRDKRLLRWRRRLTGGYAPLDPGGLAAGNLNSRWRLRLNVSALPGEE